MKLNKRIITVMAAVCSLFLAEIIYLTYFSLFQAKDIVNSSYNQRIWEKEERVLRGNIYDRSGTLLAQSRETDDGQKREYPYKELYAHSIGYNSRTYGKTNIELKFNDYLLRTQNVLDVLRSEDKKAHFENGASLELTLDHELTKTAAELMRKSNGAVTAMNPATGEVYCLYSYPSFDPNEEVLVKNWDSLTGDEASPFVARATKGLYAPGSTFKIITSAAGIMSGYENFTFKDEGKIKIDGKELKNSGGRSYGNLDMAGAFKHSSNVYFSALSQKIGADKLGSTAEDFLITKEIPFDIPTSGRNVTFSGLSGIELASTAIGQGKLLVTPMHMMMAASAIANDGIMMKPFMVRRAFYENGGDVYNMQPFSLSNATDANTAAIIKEYMIGCVKSGTGRSARVSGIEVAGKTGTAENEKEGKTHAWFVCFAPADNPQIAICVMKEYSGSGGGSVCAPIAAKLIKKALETGIITK